MVGMKMFKKQVSEQEVQEEPKQEETEEEIEQPQPKSVKKEVGYQLVQVPTQHTIAIMTPNGEVVTTEQALVELLNLVSFIKKGIIG